MSCFTLSLSQYPTAHCWAWPQYSSNAHFPQKNGTPPVSFPLPEIISNQAYNVQPPFSNHWQPTRHGVLRAMRPSQPPSALTLEPGPSLEMLRLPTLRNHTFVPLLEKRNRDRPFSVSYTVALSSRTATASRGGPTAKMSHREDGSLVDI